MNSKHFYWGDVVCLALAFSSAMSPCLAQGSTETILRTGGGAPLTTVEERLSPPGVTPAPLLMFRFGFATDETFAPGGFLDSFSVSLRNTNTGAAAILATADASGFYWAPFTPGGVAIAESAIARQPVEFPSLEPVPGNATAYDVSFALPEEFHGASMAVYFDLFDNGNAIASLGFFSDLVVVPEPSVGLLLMGGALLGAFWVKRRRRRSS